MVKKIIISIIIVAIGLSAGYGIAYIANEKMSNYEPKTDQKFTRRIP